MEGPSVAERIRGLFGVHVLRRLPDGLADPARRLARARRQRAAVRLHARGLPVETTIDPGDEMLIPRDPAHYFWVGASGLAAVERALGDAGWTGSEVHRILDVPCGHGRVLRYLRARWPESAITACDLDRGGVDFCAATFAATGVYSANPVTDVEAPTDHDLVWVGSLLTHLDAHRWPELLGWLRDRLRPGGLLVVTTHGAEVAERMAAGDDYALGADGLASVLRDHAATGFGYAPYPWDPGYGVSLSERGWVLGTATSVAGLELVSQHETAWADHHDVITLRRVEAA